MSSGPIDPRLLRYAAAARWFLAAGAVVGLVQTLSIIATAWFATSIIVRIVGGASLAELVPDFVIFALSIAVRATSVWLLDVLAARGAVQVKSQLRVRVVAAISALGPAWLASRSSGRLTTVVSTGLDALDGYFSKYLPQLILTAIATPILILVLLTQDFWTAVIVAVTLPIIPLFMVLIGWATQAVQRKQWTALTALAGGFLEVVDGLSTLTIFGRQHRQVARIEKVTDDYRSRTMAVLRVSFISGFVLELAGSLSVALVAVSIGVRLVTGELPLAVGLFVLLLTPEAYLPLRQVGAQFHAAADGVAAADDVFDILDAAGEQPARASDGSAPDVAALDVTAAAARRAGVLRVTDLSVSYGDRTVVEGFSAAFEPGRVSVLAAPSGAGKSSIVAAILGFVPSSGVVSYDGEPVSPERVRELVSWAGQRPGLAAGTVAQNIAMGEPDPELVRQSMRLAAADLVDPALVLGVNGAGLSGGQSQRVAIARAIYRALSVGTPIVILDEPTSALDLATEGEVIRGLDELAGRGLAVIVVSHREAVVAASDTIIEVRPRVAIS